MDVTETAPTQAGPEPVPTVPRPFWRRGLTFVERSLAFILWTGVIASALWLAFAFLYPPDLAETRRPFMLLNCVAFVAQVAGYHVGLACLAAAAFSLVLRRWRLLILALLVALPLTIPEWWSHLPKNPPAAGETLRIASVNIYVRNNSPHYILPELDAIDADILLFQEWHTWHDRFIRPELAEEYPHQLSFAHHNTLGMAIFSRFPFEETTPDGVDYRLGDEGLRLQRVVIGFEGRQLAVYNIHMISPGRPGALVWGQRQTAELIATLDSEPLPYILAGDFNATPHTANLDRLRDSGLAEAHDLAGRGRGTTWPARTALRRLPGFRIDHIFLSPDLTATHAAVGDYDGSDHRPIFADVGWRK